jgi:phosphatidylglycerophosphate synthase
MPRRLSTLKSWIPNAITSMRVLLLVPIFIFVQRGAPSDFSVAIGAFVVAILTDIADGVVARRLNVSTRFGCAFDASADKALAISCISLLIMHSMASIGVALALILREVAADVLRALITKRGGDTPHNYAGRAKLGFIALAVLGAWFPRALAIPLPYGNAIVDTLLLAALAFGVVSTAILWRASKTTGDRPKALHGGLDPLLPRSA